MIRIVGNLLKETETVFQEVQNFMSVYRSNHTTHTNAETHGHSRGPRVDFTDAG